MKKWASLVISMAFLASCTNDNGCQPNQELWGKWQLIETYADPGDGSGTFRKIESNKTITFHADGTITSNGDICSLSVETTYPSSGTYSMESSTFRSDNCGNQAEWWGDNHYEQKGSLLIVEYPCDEPCLEKYQKLCAIED